LQPSCASEKFAVRADDSQTKAVETAWFGQFA